MVNRSVISCPIEAPLVPPEVLHRTAVILPAYNEKAHIFSIVTNLRENFPNVAVIVINDASTDETAELAAKAGATVLHHGSNMGYGIALQTGYKYLLRQNRYDYVVQMDADGQHNYRDLPKLLHPLIDCRSDLVIGSRFLSGGNGYTIPWARRVGMWFFRNLLFLTTRCTIHDITSGLQAFNSKVLQRYGSDKMPYYYPDADVLILLIRGGVTVCEISSPMKANMEGRSMHSGFGKQLYYLLSMVLSITVSVLRSLGDQDYN